MKPDFFKETFTRLPDEKQKTIIEAAVQEFSEYGFSSANINRIAQKSQISVGSIYKYFDSKEDLFLKIVHYGVETLKTVLNDIMQSEKDFEIRIEKIINAIQVYSRSNAPLTKLYNEMATESHSNLVWKIVSDMESATAGMYTQFIKSAQEEGKIREDANAGLFAFFLDNLFILLQFSYACEYYKDRLKIYAGPEVFDNDGQVSEQLIKFIKGAFLLPRQ